MIYLFRILTFLIGGYSMYMIVSGYSAGMVPIWLLMFLSSLTLSFQRSYEFFMGMLWFKLLFACIVIIFTVLLSLIFYYGHSENIQSKADYIIVLGAKVNPEGMSLTLRKRVEKAYDYLMVHDEAIAVLSGGKGSDEPMSEAEAMYDYLISKGISDHRLIMEDQSKSTVENFDYSYERICDHAINQGKNIENLKIMMISSRFHIYRAMLIGKQEGIEVKGIGSGTLQILEPNYYLREVFAVLIQLSKFLL